MCLPVKMKSSTSQEPHSKAFFQGLVDVRSLGVPSDDAIIDVEAIEGDDLIVFAVDEQGGIKRMDNEAEFQEAASHFCKPQARGIAESLD